MGGGTTQFSLLLGSFCSGGTSPIADSERALICALVRVDLKDSTGKCELKRNATSRVWSVSSAGSCAAQDCAYGCLLSDRLNVTAFESSDYAGAFSPGRPINGSDKHDICVLTKVANLAASTSCDLVRNGAAGWTAISGSNSCAYSCATFSTLTTPKPTTTAGAVSQPSTTPTVSGGSGSAR